MGSENKPDERRQKFSKFWLGPLLAGSFLAIGYGLTRRILISQGSWQNQAENLFKEPKPFPGERLKFLRARNGVTHSELQADVATAYQAKLAARRKAEQEAKLAARRKAEQEAKLISTESQEKQIKAALDALQPINNQPEDLSDILSKKKALQLTRPTNQRSFSRSDSDKYNLKRLNRTIETLPDP